MTNLVQTTVPPPHQIFVNTSGSAFNVFVQVEDISNRPKLVRSLRNAGANITPTPKASDILLVDAATIAGKRFIRSWSLNPGMVVLETGWARSCIQAGRAFLAGDNWGGMIAVDDGLPIEAEEEETGENIRLPTPRPTPVNTVAQSSTQTRVRATQRSSSSSSRERKVRLSIDAQQHAAPTSTPRPAAHPTPPSQSQYQQPRPRPSQYSQSQPSTSQTGMQPPPIPHQHSQPQFTQPQTSLQIPSQYRPHFHPPSFSQFQAQPSPSQFQAQPSSSQLQVAQPGSSQYQLTQPLHPQYQQAFLQPSQPSTPQMSLVHFQTPSTEPSVGNPQLSWLTLMDVVRHNGGLRMLSQPQPQQPVPGYSQTLMYSPLPQMQEQGSDLVQKILSTFNFQPSTQSQFNFHQPLQSNPMPHLDIRSATPPHFASPGISVNGTSAAALFTPTDPLVMEQEEQPMTISPELLSTPSYPPEHESPPSKPSNEPESPHSFRVQTGSSTVVGGSDGEEDEAAPQPTGRSRQSGEVFLSDSGEPLRFFVQVDLQGRHGIVVAIKKNKGKIVNNIPDADYVLLFSRSKTYQGLVKEAHHAGKPPLQSSFVTECIQQSALLDERFYELDVNLTIKKRVVGVGGRSKAASATGKGKVKEVEMDIKFEEYSVDKAVTPSQPPKKTEKKRKKPAPQETYAYPSLEGNNPKPKKHKYSYSTTPETDIPATSQPPPSRKSDEMVLMDNMFAEDFETITQFFASGRGENEDDETAWADLANHKHCRSVPTWPEFYQAHESAVWNEIKTRVEASAANMALKNEHRVADYSY